MAFGLYVPVGVGRLADGRVPHLTLHPSEIGAIREQPGCKGVAGGVVLPVGQAGLAQKRLPDMLKRPQRTALCRDVLAVFVRIVFGWMRRWAGNEGLRDGQCGAVTVIQRFGSR